jgi:hypothetical protein
MSGRARVSRASRLTRIKRLGKSFQKTGQKTKKIMAMMWRLSERARGRMLMA